MSSKSIDDLWSLIPSGVSFFSLLRTGSMTLLFVNEDAANVDGELTVKRALAWVLTSLWWSDLMLSSSSIQQAKLSTPVKWLLPSILKKKLSNAGTCTLVYRADVSWAITRKANWREAKWKFVNHDNAVGGKRDTNFFDRRKFFSHVSFGWRQKIKKKERERNGH